MSTLEPIIRFADLNETIADDLYRDGHAVIDDYINPNLVAQLVRKIDHLECDNSLKRAGIGREKEYKKRLDIRRDFIHWLEKDNDEDRLYLLLMEDLRLCLNKHFFLGLFEYEAHYALYDKGGFYKKHLDSFKGAKNRLVSTVCYLNENWQNSDGGRLLLFDQENPDQIIKEITPQAGRLVVFFSEEIWHEVSPSMKPRKSIAGWFRCNSSHEDKANPIV